MIEVRVRRPAPRERDGAVPGQDGDVLHVGRRRAVDAGRSRGWPEPPADGAPAAAGEPGAAIVIEDFPLDAFPDASFVVNVTAVVPNGNTFGASATIAGDGRPGRGPRAGKEACDVGVGSRDRAAGRERERCRNRQSRPRRVAHADRERAARRRAEAVRGGARDDRRSDLERRTALRDTADRIGGSGSVPSCAEMTYVTAAPPGPVASTTRLAGTFRIGTADRKVHDLPAGVASALPATSSARTANECVPSARFE